MMTTHTELPGSMMAAYGLHVRTSMAHNIDSMAYYGERPWHGLGTNIPARANSLQMIGAAGLNWEVAMKPIPNVGAHADKKARRFHLIRMPRNTDEIEVPLGVVSARYRALQNKEAFEFFDPIIGDSKAVFETAGSLGNGERIWVLAKVPGEIRVTGDDICSKYLLLSNAHDGRGSVSVKFTPIRRYPSSGFDLSVVVPLRVYAATVQADAAAFGGPLLESILEAHPFPTGAWRAPAANTNVFARESHMDLLAAKAQYACQFEMSCPEVAERSPLVFTQARHPLLIEQAARQEASGAPPERRHKVVPIDIRLGQDFDVLVITGSNTGANTFAGKIVDGPGAVMAALLRMS